MFCSSFVPTAPAEMLFHEREMSCHYRRLKLHFRVLRSSSPSNSGAKDQRKKRDAAPSEGSSGWEGIQSAKEGTEGWGGGWKANLRRQRGHPPLWEMSNTINGIFTLPTSCSSSRPVNLTHAITSGPPALKANPSQPYLIRKGTAADEGVPA